MKKSTPVAVLALYGFLRKEAKYLTIRENCPRIELFANYYLSAKDMIAVIKTGGKQYKVKEKKIIKIEKLDAKVGDKVEFSEVLLTADDNGKGVKIGQPLVEGAKVSAKVIENGRDKKIEVVKYKPKTRYKKVVGHRQPYTKVEIVKIA